MAMAKVLLLGILLVGGSSGRTLLPQALEDVHRYVQRQLLHRSQGEQRKLGMAGPPPPGGAAFQTTQPFMGTPVVLQGPLHLDGKGGIQMPGFPIHGDPATAGSQIVSQVVAPPGPPAPLPTGLMPPVPLQLNPGDLQVQASSNTPGIIPANMVGPSTYVSEVPRNNAGPPPPPPPPPQQQYQQQPQQQAQQQYQQQQPQQTQQYQQQVPPQGQNGEQKSMDGWVPLDNEGSRFAKGVGVKIQTDDDLARPEPQRQPDYKDTAYSIRTPDGQQVDNELEIIPTNSVKLDANPDEDVVIRKEQKRQFPIYPGRDRTNARVVIHAQNVIIRGGPDGGIEQIDANNDTLGPVGNPAVKQYPAYQQVPQLNNFLREQLRFAAMNQLLQSAMADQQHPLSGKPFPRPLSLKELAAAVRNGDFPQPTRDQLLVDPMTTQPSMLNPTHLQLNIPHMVKLNPDAASADPLTLPSIHSQGKVAVPGGLGNLYKNILQQEAAGSDSLFDPTDPVEYSLLAALSGQRSKANLRSPKPPSTLDYGDSVKYSAAVGDLGKSKNKQPIQPIQILETDPNLSYGKPGTGNLRDVSDQVLKQLLLQELREVEDEPQILLPAGLGPQAPAIHRPFRTLKPSYGSNAHPFAFLAEEELGGGGGVHSAHVPENYEETFEYTLPPGMSVDDYLNDEGGLHFLKKKKPRRPSIYGLHGLHGIDGLEEEESIDPDVMPLNKDTLVKLGKSALSTALEFSRHHNPLTFLNRLRSLPPVKVDLYKVPMGIPESLIQKFPQSSGGPPPSHYARRDRGRKKHLSRKNNSKHH